MSKIKFVRRNLVKSFYISKAYCYFIGFFILAVRFIIVIMRMLKYKDTEVHAINQWSATTGPRTGAGS